jgi:predicted  nucleic acid-binding Zn-ribbon protein
MPQLFPMPAAKEACSLSNTAKQLETPDLDELVVRRGRLTREVDNLVAEVEALRSELEDYRSKSALAKADLDAQLRVLQAKLRTEEAESALRRAKIEQGAEEVATRQALAEKTIELLREQKEVLEANLSETREKRRLVEDQAAEAARKVDATGHELATMRRELSEATERVSNFKQEHAELLATIEKEREKLARTQTDRDVLLGEIDKRHIEISALRGEIEVLRGDSLRLREQVAEDQVRIEQTVARLKVLRLEVEGLDAKHAARVLELEGEIAAKREVAKAEATEQSREIITRANVAAAQVLRDAKSAATDMKTLAEAEAARLRAETEEQSRELVANATRESEALRGRAQGDYDVVLSGALQVKAEANALRHEASLAAEAVRVKAESERKAVLVEAEVTAGRIRKEASDEAEAVVAEAQSKAAISKVQADRDAKKIVQAAEAEYRRRVDRGKQEVAEQLSHHQAKLAALKQQAEKQAAEYVEAANQSARELTGKVAAIKAKAEADADAHLTAAKVDAEKIRAEADRLSALSRERADNEYTERKRECDEEIAARKIKAGDDIKAWREEQEAILQGRRDADIERTARKVRRAIETRMEKVLTAAHVMDAARGIAPEVADIVRKVMSSDVEIEQEQLQRILGGKPAVSNPFKEFMLRFGMKIAIAGGGILAVVLVVWIVSALSEASRTQPSRTATYVATVQNERKVARQWNPPQTPEWKDSWTDNVIYTTGWYEREMDRKFQDKWIIALNRFVTRRLDLNDDVVVRIVPMEVNLIRRLGAMRNQITPATEKSGIANMRATEADVVRRMEDLLGGPRNLNAYKDFKRQFHAEYRPD